MVRLILASVSAMARAERADLLFSFLLNRHVEAAEVGVEQLAAVGAEHVVGEEGVELVDQEVFAEEEGAGGGVAGRGVALLGGAHVVRDLVAGPAVHAPPTQRAEQVGAEQVGAFGVRVAGVRPGGAAGAESVPADLLDLDEGVEIDQCLVYWSGDQIHSATGLRELPPDLRARRFHTMCPVCLGLVRMSRTLE